MSVTMEMFVLLMDHTSMRAEWRCASIISGELCVIVAGTQLMLPLSANSWDMPTLDVCIEPSTLAIL